MLGRRLINTGAVACTTDTVQILDAGSTQSLALYRFEDNATDTASGTGKFGKGAVFNGSNSEITLPAALSDGSTTDTNCISFWFNVGAEVTSSSSGNEIMSFSKSGSNTGKIALGSTTGNFSNETFSVTSDVANQYTYITETIPAGWNHAVVQWNSSTTKWDIYLNGQAKSTSTFGTNEQGKLLLKFGNRSSYYFDGKLDQVRVFNKSLSSSEVTTLYNETSSTVNTLQILGDTSCIATYTFEGNAQDLSGNYYHGSASNIIYDYSGTASNVTYVTGKFGKAVSFNGTDASIDIESKSLIQNDIKSFSFWFKNKFIFGFYDPSSASSSDRRRWFIDNTTNGSIKIQVNNDQYNYEQTGITEDSNWHHLAVIDNGSIYLDGNLLSNTFNTSYWITNGTNGTSRDTIRMGSGDYIGSASVSFVEGLMDQMRFFDKTLTAPEINSLYTETATSAALGTIDNPSTVAYYKMADATDETGLYNLTASNVDFNVQGKYGFAGKFNGTNSYLYAANSVQQPTKSFSVSCWVNFYTIKAASVGVIGNFKTGVTPQIGWAIAHQSGTPFQFWADGTASSNGAKAQGTTNPVAGIWYNIVGTYDGTNIKIYVNGLLEGTTAYSATPAQTDQPLVIGRWYGNYDDLYTDGKIDQVRIFNKAISADEVTKLYNEIQCANTIATPESYFDTALYVGDNTNRDITSIGFKPGFVWIKNRDANYNHALYDSVRGPGTSSASNQLSSNTDNDTAWHSPNYGYLSAFLDNGFSLTNGSINGSSVNANNNNTVAWAWKAGSSNVTNNDGTISSTVSASPESGFSIVTYSPNNTVGMSIGHGLSKAPSLVITKRLDTTQDWGVYTNVSTGDTTTNWLSLNDADAYGSGSYMTIKSTTLELPQTGAFWASNSSNQVAYCFANIDGYQRISSYVGTGINENFIYTGFEPAWVLIKNVSTGIKNWVIADNKRDNADEWLYANDSSDAYDDANTYTRFYENGFSVAANGSFVNTSGDSYIFLAIAANPDTTAPTKANSFKTKIYIGDGGTQSITGVGFKPDLTWVKNRSTTGNHALIDSVRGVSKPINANQDYLEQNYPGFTLTSFLDDGFSVTDNSDGLYGWNGPAGSTYGGSTGGYVSWNWKALDHDRNLASINNDGSITSLVSANPAAGFSIVKYRSIANLQQFGVGHGLSSAPEIILQKKYGPSSTSVSNWYVITSVIDGSIDYLNLNGTAIKTDMTGTFANFQLGSSTFTDWWTGPDQDIINYCWHSVAGYSKIGTYEGTNSTVTVSDVGFKPSFVMIKNVDDTGNWVILDNSRNTITDRLNNWLRADTNGAETGAVSTAYITVNDNGFIVANTTSLGTNSNGDTYLYMAFK